MMLMMLVITWHDDPDDARDTVACHYDADAADARDSL